MRAAVRASAVAVCVALFTIGVATQQRGGTAQTDKVQPVNSGANPYRVIRDWARLEAEGRPWGGSNGVAIDRDGRICVGDRSVLTGYDSWLPWDQGKPGPSFR